MISFKKDIKTLLERKGKCTIFIYVIIAVDIQKSSYFTLATIFIKGYTALYNVLGSIVIDFTFIHRTYILNTFLM